MLYLTELTTVLKKDVRTEVRFLIQDHLSQIKSLVENRKSAGVEAAAQRYLVGLIDQAATAQADPKSAVHPIPPGSPIGMDAREMP